MTSRERVKRAIDRRGPDRVPLRFYRRPEESDIIVAGYTAPRGWQAPRPGEDEWGCVWSTLTQTLGQVKEHPLADWQAIGTYRWPDPHAPGRIDRARDLKAAYPDRYLAGSLGISGFNRLTFLRGFENLLMDLFLEPEKLAALADRMVEFELAIVEQFIELGVDGIYFWDDWGTEQGLMISPETWRRFFKPRYHRQFERIHRAGLHVFFHSCGNVWAILDDLIEAGADVFHLNQPQLWGIDPLAEHFGGRVCLHCPVDIQRTLVYGADDDVRREARELCEKLGRFDGGFIACADEGQGHGTVSAERLDLQARAFREYGAVGRR